MESLREVEKKRLRVGKRDRFSEVKAGDVKGKR